MKCTMRTVNKKMCTAALAPCSQLCKVCWPVICLSVRSVTTPTESISRQTKATLQSSNNSCVQQMKGNNMTEATQKTILESEGTKVERSSNNSDNTDINTSNQFVKLYEESPSRKSITQKKPVGNIVMTACGRFLNWEIYREALDAMLDKRWAKAIVLESHKDKDYLEAMREHGTVINVIREIQSYKYDNDGVRDEIMMRVQNDENLAINLCAVQDAYVRIRQERRDDEIARIAEGKSGNVSSSLRERAGYPFGSE